MTKENIEEFKKEVEEAVRGNLDTGIIVLTGLVAGGGMYILGRSRGKVEGRADGYEQAIRDLFKEIRKVGDDK